MTASDHLAIQWVGLAREKGRVAFDLDQVEVAGRIDHLLEQARRRCLRMPEQGAVELHVLRVAADVGNQEQLTPCLHAATLTGGNELVRNGRTKMQSLEACCRASNRDYGESPKN